MPKTWRTDTFMSGKGVAVSVLAIIGPLGGFCRRHKRWGLSLTTSS